MKGGAILIGPFSSTQSATIPRQPASNIPFTRPRHLMHAHPAALPWLAMNLARGCPVVLTWPNHNRPTPPVAGANVWSLQRPAYLGVDELLWIKPWECQPDAVSHNRHVSIAALLAGLVAPNGAAAFAVSPPTILGMPAPPSSGHARLTLPPLASLAAPAAPAPAPLALAALAPTKFSMTPPRSRICHPHEEARSTSSTSIELRAPRRNGPKSLSHGNEGLKDTGF
ncbi:hypothetical protein CCHR01_07321 [Colletotrichum chrysophilum]|uniref:Uncharacterized protein n=1 Tax=Colletotrichum chrysophilum TaxID=1836956 RepID=A0AAD9EIZ3_9PEZI|nr:hypothetical protein CCHR01_07321 [Colletotrichum chrysophilum]